MADAIYDYREEELDPKLQDISKRKRQFDFKRNAIDKIRRITSCNHIAGEGANPGRQRRVALEPGVDDGPNDDNKKINDQTINVGWDEVGGMRNVIIALGIIALAAWIVKK
jgi:hypothetical protein